MPKLKIDLKKLSKDSKGYRRDIEIALGIVESTLIRKLKGDRPLSLDELNTICGVIRRHPQEFIMLEGGQ